MKFVKPQRKLMPNTKISAEDVIKIASAEVGYKEKNSNSNLDDFTANAGSGNWTKYARDLALAGYYNGNKNSFAWCDVFVDWCFYQACGKDANLAQAIECQTGDCGAGCEFSAQYYKNAGRWSSNPSIGAQIFFYGGGGIGHTGLVEKVDDNYITTIEGNSSDKVARRTYARNNTNIAGYGLPKYDVSISAPSLNNNTNSVKNENTNNSSMVQVSLPCLRKDSIGQVVKSLQVLLKQKGYSVGRCGIDGEFGRDTENAVKLFQSANKIECDGIVGKDTWGKLIN